jgi:hypothetical protein
MECLLLVVEQHFTLVLFIIVERFPSGAITVNLFGNSFDISHPTSFRSFKRYVIFQEVKEKF